MKPTGNCEQPQGWRCGRTRALGGLQPGVTSRGWRGLQAQLQGGPRPASPGAAGGPSRPPSLREGDPKPPCSLFRVLVQIYSGEISEASEKRSQGTLSDLCDHPRCPEIWISKLNSLCCSPSPLPCSPSGGDNVHRVTPRVTAPLTLDSSCPSLVSAVLFYGRVSACPRDPSEPFLSSPKTRVWPSAGALPTSPPEVTRVTFPLGSLGVRPALTCTPRHYAATGATAWQSGDREEPPALRRPSPRRAPPRRTWLVPPKLKLFLPGSE